MSQKGEEMSFLYLSLEDVYDLSVKLAEKILERKINVEAIVGISRGGLLPARLLSDFLGISRLEIIKAEFYTAPGETVEKPVIVRPASKSLKGKTVLIVDDVADSGETFIEAKRHLLDLGASKIFTSALYVKPWNKALIDFHVGESDSWIIFPWERVETIENLTRKYGEEAYAMSTIPEGLLKTIRRIIEMRRKNEPGSRD